MYVLDTSVILTHAGILGSFLEEGIAIPPSVLEEVQLEPQKSRLEELIDAGIEVIQPDEEFVEKVKETATSMGEIHMSYTDVSVVALALQLEATILTEDYSIQNIAQSLKIPWRALSTRGIRKVYVWGLKCTGCGRVYREPPGEVCPICGGNLRRWRLKDKEKLNLSK